MFFSTQDRRRDSWLAKTFQLDLGQKQFKFLEVWQDRAYQRI